MSGVRARAEVEGAATRGPAHGRGVGHGRARLGHSARLVMSRLLAVPCSYRRGVTRCNGVHVRCEGTRGRGGRRNLRWCGPRVNAAPPPVPVRRGVPCGRRRGGGARAARRRDGRHGSGGQRRRRGGWRRGRYRWSGSRGGRLASGRRVARVAAVAARAVAAVAVAALAIAASAAVTSLAAAAVAVAGGAAVAGLAVAAGTAVAGLAVAAVAALAIAASAAVTSLAAAAIAGRAVAAVGRCVVAGVAGWALILARWLTAARAMTAVVRPGGHRTVSQGERGEHRRDEQRHAETS